MRKLISHGHLFLFLTFGHILQNFFELIDFTFGIYNRNYIHYMTKTTDKVPRNPKTKQVHKIRLKSKNTPWFWHHQHQLIYNFQEVKLHQDDLAFT